MKHYEGQRLSDGRCVVTVHLDKRDTGGQPLEPRRDLIDHSPGGFNWGYGGSGPAQLALAILADCCGDETAELFHQTFKWAIVCRFPKDAPWELTEREVEDWLVKTKAEALARSGAQQLEA